MKEEVYLRKASVFGWFQYHFQFLAFHEIEKRRKSLELEKQKFFSDLIQGSRYSFTSGDQTHSILQKETQKCLDSVLKPDNFDLLKRNFNFAYHTQGNKSDFSVENEIEVRNLFAFKLLLIQKSCTIAFHHEFIWSIYS